MMVFTVIQLVGVQIRLYGRVCKYTSIISPRARSSNNNDIGNSLMKFKVCRITLPLEYEVSNVHT